MGDMADYALEQQENWSTDLVRPATRRRYPSNYGDDEDDEWAYAKPRSKFTRTCRFCGVSGLQWVDTEQGWKLYNRDGQKHVCAAGAAPRASMTCKFCGTTGLRWKFADDRWFLVDNMNCRHYCLRR